MCKTNETYVYCCKSILVIIFLPISPPPIYLQQKEIKLRKLFLDFTKLQLSSFLYYSIL